MAIYTSPRSGAKRKNKLCALLLSHGADPYVKNQEGQTTIEVASQDDVRCLLRYIRPTRMNQLFSVSRDAMWQGEQNETSISQNITNEESDPPSKTLGKALISM